MGRNGKDSGVALRGTKQRHTTVRGSLVSACEAGMKRTYFREGNAEHGLQELWKRWNWEWCWKNGVNTSCRKW